MKGTYRGAMQVIKENMVELNKGYTELSHRIHELVTDCWSLEQQAELEARVDAMARQMSEKARVIQEMLPVMYKQEKKDGP